jgi:aspartate carbamoyltransferase catalytic subunit
MQLLPVMEGLHSAEAFTRPFVEAFLELVREIERQPDAYADSLRGKVIATVFEEPSTRTRLSFEAAAHRMGAGVITVADPKTSSAVKGETLRDAARVIGGYADLLVWRNPKDGASRLAAQYAGVPVINGGDGRLGHPTQTLLDLFILHKQWGSFEGRVVAILGDLLHGRTARSLAWGLCMMGASVVILPGPGLDWEAGFEGRILDRYGYRLSRVSHPLFQQWTGNQQARVLEPRGMVQGRLFQGEAANLESLDAVYLTRLQDERGANAASSGVFPGLRFHQLRDPLLRRAVFLHPLPRRLEIPVEVDSDPRAVYFEQAKMGPLVRQAVYLASLKADQYQLPPLRPLPSGDPDHGLGTCPNPSCITHGEGLLPPWRIEGTSRRIFLCAYCDTALQAHYVGCRSSRRIHPAHSPQVLKIRPENLRPFADREFAIKQGFEWGGG